MSQTIEQERAVRQSAARCEVYRRLPQQQRHDKATLYALWALESDEPLRVLRSEPRGLALLESLRREYLFVVAPARARDGLSEWSPPAGFFPASRPPRSVATRVKISEAQRGRAFSEAHRHKISVALRGHRTTEQTRAAISAANRRRSWTVESRAKVSASLRERRHTQATRQKMSNASRGRSRDSSGRWMQQHKGE